MKKNNLIFWIVIIIVVGATIFFMPNIYKKLQDMDTPKVENKEINQNVVDKKEKISMDSKIIESLTFPVMRNDKTKIESYYDLNKITINNFSNNDILYNAFLDMYDGYLIDNGKVGCTNNSKEFDATYLKSRIKNIIGKDIKYTFEDFTVPNNNINNKYIGLWKYDSTNNKYVYYGNCDNLNNNTIYYDLKKLYKVDSSDDNNIIYLYYYIGVAKIENNNYTLYSDIKMTNEIMNGTINDINEIENIFNSIDTSSLKTYKYTFKLGLCSYDNYCFYEGEWIND